MVSEREQYAIRMLNITISNIDITKKEKVSLLDEFIKQIRKERKE